MPLPAPPAAGPPEYSSCEVATLNAHPSAVKLWLPLLRLQFPYQLVPKAAYVIRYESGGNWKAIGDGGYSVGLYQIQHKGRFATRPSKEALMVPHFNIRYAAKVLRADHNVWTDWGEGALYNGQPFGALGNHPYPCNDSMLGLNPLPDVQEVAKVVAAYPSRLMLEEVMYWMARAPELAGQYQIFQSYLSTPVVIPPITPPAPPPDNPWWDIDIPDIDLPDIPDLGLPWDIVEKIGDFINAITDTIEAEVEGLTTGLIGKVDDIVDEIKSGITGTLDSVFDTIVDKVGDVINGIGDSIDGVANIIDGLTDKITDSITFSGRLVKGAVDRVISGIESTLIPALDTIKNLTDTIVTGTVEGTIGLASDALDALAGATESAIGVIDKVASSFVELTDGIVQGIIDGIQSGISLAVDAIDRISDFLANSFPQLMRDLGSNILDISGNIAGLPVALATAMGQGFIGLFATITEGVGDLDRFIPDVTMERLI